MKPKGNKLDEFYLGISQELLELEKNLAAHSRKAIIIVAKKIEIGGGQKPISTFTPVELKSFQKIQVCLVR